MVSIIYDFTDIRSRMLGENKPTPEIKKTLEEKIQLNMIYGKSMIDPDIPFYVLHGANPPSPPPFDIGFYPRYRVNYRLDD